MSSCSRREAYIADVTWVVLMSCRGHARLPSPASATFYNRTARRHTLTSHLRFRRRRGRLRVWHRRRDLGPLCRRLDRLVRVLRTADAARAQDENLSLQQIMAQSDHGAVLVTQQFSMREAEV